MELRDTPDRKSWKQDLAPLPRDRPRAAASARSRASSCPTSASGSSPRSSSRARWLAIGLGLVATVFLMRMYSLFHDLTHNSLFESRAANRRWGHLLGFLLFTPYRWWQRQHSLHHAHTGNLDHRGPGEIYTMTARRVRERLAPAAARLPRLPQPAADAARRAEPRLPLRAPLPAAGHVAEDPAQRRARPTSRSSAGRSAGARWSAGRPSC